MLFDAAAVTGRAFRSGCVVADLSIEIVCHGFLPSTVDHRSSTGYLRSGKQKWRQNLTGGLLLFCGDTDHSLDIFDLKERIQYFMSVKSKYYFS